MKSKPVHSLFTVLSALVLGAGFLHVPVTARAQQAQSRLTPLIVNPSAEALGPTLRLSHERVDLSTITREDRTLRVGSELSQGESVTRLRQQHDSAARLRRQQAIREQDDLRQKREKLFDD
jgi:hypothetical protein